MVFVLSTKSNPLHILKAFFIGACDRLFVGYCLKCKNHLSKKHKRVCLDCLLLMLDSEDNCLSLQARLFNHHKETLEAFLLLHLIDLDPRTVLIYEPFFKDFKKARALFKSYGSLEKISWEDKEVIYLGQNRQSFEKLYLIAQASGVKTFKAFFLNS